MMLTQSKEQATQTCLLEPKLPQRVVVGWGKVLSNNNQNDDDVAEKL